MTKPRTPEQKARYNKFPGWARFIIDHPTFSRWAPATLPLLIGCVLALWNPIFFLAGLALTGAYFVLSLKEVPAQDEQGRPNIALFVVFGVRLPISFKEGLVLTIPGISELIFFSRQQENKDFTFEGVRFRLDSAAKGRASDGFLRKISSALTNEHAADAKSGGETNVYAGITVESTADDEWSLLDLDNVGNLDGAIAILRDAIAEDIRQIARQLTWLEASFATDLVSVKIINDMIGDDSGEAVLKNPSESDVRKYLETVRVNGFPDAKGLGLKIRRINITRVEPIGKLREAAETTAIEELRRQGMLKNAAAIAEGVKLLKKKGLQEDGSVTSKDLADMLLVNDPDARVTREIKDIKFNDIPGVLNALEKLFGK
jgi:hypothetical protein